MRVTELTMGSQLTKDLQGDLAAMTQVQQQLSSGNRINEPSDDPIGTERLLQLQAQTAENTQYATDTQGALSWLDAAQSALGQAVQVGTQVRTLALQAANTTSGTEGLSAAYDQVQQLYASLVTIGNTQFGSQYLFNGQQAVAPFTLSSSGTAVTTNYGASTGSQDLVRQVGAGTTVTINPGTNSPTSNVFQWSSGSLTGGLLPAVQQIMADMGTTPSAPTLTQAPGASSLSAQTYNVTYAYTNSNGTTSAAAPASAISLSGAGNTVSFQVALPSGATGIDVYVGTSASPTELAQVSSTGAITYSGGATSGLSATVTGSTLTVTVSAAASASGAASHQLNGNDLTTLDSAIQAVQDAQAQTGAVMQRVQFAQSSLTSQGTMLQTLSGSLQGADVAKEAVRLQQLQDAYQGALAVGSQMILPTLAKYLP